MIVIMLMALALAGVLAPACAHAETAAQSVVDFGPLLSQVVLPALASLLAAGLFWIGKRLLDLIGIKINEVQLARLKAAADKAAAVAVAQLGGKIPAQLQVGSPIVAAGVNALLLQVKSTAENLGKSPDQLADMILSRLAIMSPHTDAKPVEAPPAVLPVPVVVGAAPEPLAGVNRPAPPPIAA